MIQIDILYLQISLGTRDRNRTYDTQFRKLVLYPLSYARKIWMVLLYNRGRRVSKIANCSIITVSMENKIKQYEREIKAQTEKVTGLEECIRLSTYHQEMVANFQHERLIHLIIMLFFVIVSLGLIGGLMYSVCYFGLTAMMIPYYLLTLIVVILTFFYVKHYYFLENHVQELYEYTKKIYDLMDDSGKNKK